MTTNDANQVTQTWEAVSQAITARMRKTMATGYAILQVTQLGKEVAAHLGPEWTAHYEQRYSWKDVVIVSQPDGASLELYIAGERVHIRGGFPPGGLPPGVSLGIFPGRNPCRYSSVGPIGVAISKSPAVIARDIQRRFLPRYLAAYKHCVEAQRQHEEREVRKAAIIDELSKLAGRPAKNDTIYLQHGTVQVPLYSDGSFGNLHLSPVPIDLLKVLVRAIADHEERTEREASNDQG